MTDARPTSPVPPHPSGGGPAPVSGPAGWQPVRPAGVPGLRGTREDLRGALLTALALAVAGLAVGALWVALAPRADFRVTADDVVPVRGTPSPELFMADDGVFVLLLAALGLLAGVVVWLRRRRRGALTLVALATGMLAAGLAAWQLGERLAPGPTDAQLTDVGATVTTGVTLGATAALAVGPFVAVLVYVVAAGLTATDDLGRAEDLPGPPSLPVPGAQAPVGGPVSSP